MNLIFSCPVFSGHGECLISTVSREIFILEGVFLPVLPSLFFRPNILHSFNIFSNISWKWSYELQDKYLVFLLMGEQRRWDSVKQFSGTSQRNISKRRWTSEEAVNRTWWWEESHHRGTCVWHCCWSRHGAMHAAPLGHRRMLPLDKNRIWVDIACTG